MSSDGAETELDRVQGRVIRSGFSKDVALRNARRAMSSQQQFSLSRATRASRPVVTYALRVARALYRRIAPAIAPYVRRLVFLMNAELHRTLSEQIRQSASEVSQLRTEVTHIGTALRKVDSAVHRTYLRIDDDSMLVRANAGLVVCPMSELASISALIDTGDLEFGTRLVIERLLRPGAVFLDVGAHLGVHTIAAARSVGPTGLVISIESQPTNVECIRRSAAVNCLEAQVRVHQSAARRERSAAIEKHLSGRTVDLVRVGPQALCPRDLQQLGVCVDNSDLALIVSGCPIDPNDGSSQFDWIAALTDLGWRWCAIDEHDGTIHHVSLSKLRANHTANVLIARPQSTTWQRLATYA